MTARRGATNLAGVLLVDKPQGLTSHDVLLAVRRATGERRIGHAGTLDPMATGLLFVLVGVATRLERYLVGHDKSYRARISFGVATDTLDAEGAVTETAPVPPGTLTDETARRLLAATLGPQDQDPPAYSAIKTDGVPAHRTARAGGTPVLEPRPITVHAAELVAIDAASLTWEVDFRVSKGTYVRALARDLGTAAGTVAHLTGLRRTSVGEVGVRDSHPLADVLEAREREHLDPRNRLAGGPAGAVEDRRGVDLKERRRVTARASQATGLPLYPALTDRKQRADLEQVLEARADDRIGKLACEAHGSSQGEHVRRRAAAVDEPQRARTVDRLVGQASAG